jgi:hypothetical protein
MMGTRDYPIPTLEAVFDGAKCFGLTEREVWQAFDESLTEAGPDATVSEYVHELTGELAQRILQKQRRAPAEEGVASGERR